MRVGPQSQCSMRPDLADAEPQQDTANDIIAIVPQIGQPQRSQSEMKQPQAVAEKWNLLEGGLLSR